MKTFISSVDHTGRHDSLSVANRAVVLQLLHVSVPSGVDWTKLARVSPRPNTLGLHDLHPRLFVCAQSESLLLSAEVSNGSLVNPVLKPFSMHAPSTEIALEDRGGELRAILLDSISDLPIFAGITPALGAALVGLARGTLVETTRPFRPQTPPPSPSAILGMPIRGVLLSIFACHIGEDVPC